jgi:integrase
VAEDDLRLEVAAAIRLLLLTAARLNEALTIQREWIDLDRRVINLPDSKTGKKPLFLSDAAVEVIPSLQESHRNPENPFLLPGRQKGKSLNNLSKLWRWVCERVGSLRSTSRPTSHGGKHRSWLRGELACDRAVAGSSSAADHTSVRPRRRGPCARGGKRGHRSDRPGTGHWIIASVED